MRMVVHDVRSPLLWRWRFPILHAARRLRRPLPSLLTGFFFGSAALQAFRRRPRAAGSRQFFAIGRQADFAMLMAPIASRRQARRFRSGGNMRLKGKSVIVTGAGQGFGLGIAETFAREGARVACLDFNADLAKSAAARIGAGAIALTCDVSKKDQVEAAVQAAVST